MSDLRTLAMSAPLDMAIIGGGINGCGIAREAARAGLRVALFERDDFGFGTTWRSTKLIHGGLRYLEHGDVRLVFESLSERRELLRARPHLVQRQELVLPMLPWTRRPRWQLAAGLTAYDALAWRGGVPRHRWLDKGEVEERMPWLPESQEGGFSFYDARARAPERIALEMALEAKAAGAAVFNHTEVTGVRCRGAAVSAVDVVRDGVTWEIPVDRAVNAAGPWVDAFNQAVGRDVPPLLGMTRGSHIVLEVDYDEHAAVFSTARADGRVFFAVPQDGLLLVGTTDVRDEGPPSSVRPTLDEVDYLLAEAQALMPGLPVSRGDIRYAYAGLRPLQGESGPESAISRRHEVLDHETTDEGPAGLYSVIGGKLSTFRPVAKQLLWYCGVKPAPESHAPLDRDWWELLKAAPVARETKLRLRNYGPALTEILRPPVEMVWESPQVLYAEIEHCVRREMATTLSDVMLRRTGLSWRADRGLPSHEAVAHAMAPLLGWDRARVDAEVENFRRDLRRNLPALDELGDDAI